MIQLERRRRRRLTSRQRAEVRRELEAELRRLGPAGEGPRTRKLLDALRRVAQPEFGLCYDCGQAISYQRLLVLPETSVCVGCSQHREGWAGPCAEDPPPNSAPAPRWLPPGLAGDAR